MKQTNPSHPLPQSSSRTHTHTHTCTCRVYQIKRTVNAMSLCDIELITITCSVHDSDRFCAVMTWRMHELGSCVCVDKLYSNSSNDHLFCCLVIFPSLTQFTVLWDCIIIAGINISLWLSIILCWRLSIHFVGSSFSFVHLQMWEYYWINCVGYNTLFLYSD